MVATISRFSTALSRASGKSGESSGRVGAELVRQVLQLLHDREDDAGDVALRRADAAPRPGASHCSG
eukprot:4867338-Pyramimonas_sp.AAC.1